jgi:hypothetical protein
MLASMMQELLAVASCLLKLLLRPPQWSVAFC